MTDLANGNAVVASSASALENTENIWIEVPANFAVHLAGHADGDLNNNGATNAQDYLPFRQPLGLAAGPIGAGASGVIV